MTAVLAEAPAAGTPAAEAPALAAEPLSLEEEVSRVLAAESPEDVLGVTDYGDEAAVSRAWKRLMLKLHPDKACSVDDQARDACAEALVRVHEAKDDLRQRQQAYAAEVPLAPEMERFPHCQEACRGARKYEVAWKALERQDPCRPVEKYEVWGPKYFSDAGEPYDWILLATLPPLQTHFVLVEEAPTQQDVMWAADRVRRATLPLMVYAANGKGQSEALTVELPWAEDFPWLHGALSVLCPSCHRLCPRRGAFTPCLGCRGGIPAQTTLVLRCKECQGEVLWVTSVDGRQKLSCTCCSDDVVSALPLHPPSGGGQQWQKIGDHAAQPPHRPRSASGCAGASGGRHFGSAARGGSGVPHGRGGSGRSW